MSQEGTARFWLAFTSALLIITIGADDASHATFSPWSRCRALRTNPAAVSVYAYPVPPVLTDDLIRCFTAERQYAPWSDGDPIGAPYTSDVLLHRAVLRHPGLTEDPSRADVFFLPFYGSVSTRLRRKCSGTDHRQRAALLARIARQSPWFARRAADHVAVFSHFDVCCRQQPSYLMQGGGPLQSVVVSSRMLVFQLDLWFPQSGGGAACERDFVHERFAGARERDACRVRVIPYAARRSLAVLEEELPRERHIFAFFAGNVNLAFCRGDLHASPWARHCKVRHAVVRGFANQPDCKVYATHVPDYERYMLNSTFCLIPRGDNPTSNRLFDAIWAGCIPVIISENIDLALPFSNFVEWTQFTIRVPQDLVLNQPPLLLRLLRTLPAPQVRAMRQALWQVRHNFMYGVGLPHNQSNAVGGLAELAMASLLCPLTPVPAAWGVQPQPPPLPPATTAPQSARDSPPAVPTALWSGAIQRCLTRCGAMPDCKAVVWGTAEAPFPGCHLKRSNQVTPLNVTPHGPAAPYSVYLPALDNETWTFHPAADIYAPTVG